MLSRLCLSLLVGVSFFVSGSTVFAQSTGLQINGEQIEQDEWNRGYHGLALICRSRGLTLHESLRTWNRIPSDERMMIVLGDWIPSQLELNREVRNGSGVLLACDGTSRVSILGSRFHFSQGMGSAVSPDDGFQKFSDCPIVTQWTSSHPVAAGINRVETNRPGVLRMTPDPKRFTDLAIFPRTIEYSTSARLAVASNDSDSRRVVFCSDPSVFSNQMLVLEDNAKFAIQTLDWLKGEKRTDVLLVIDGQFLVPPDPTSMNVDIPPFSPKDVMDALKYLPKDKLLEVGNSVATMVEDENLPNEVLASVAKDVDAVKYQRALIFMATALLGLFLLFRYLTSESLLQDALGIGKNPDKLMRIESKNRHRSERKAVATELVSRFYEELTEGERTDALEFPAGVKIARDRREVWKEMKRLGKQMRKKDSWWSPARLHNLVAQIEYWGELKNTDTLLVKSKSQTV